jgi:hypothetical protein
MELYQASYDAYFTAYGNRPPPEVRSRLGQRLFNAVGSIHFVGSPEVIAAAETVLDGALEELGSDRDMSGDFLDRLDQLQVVARKDLGHLEALTPQGQTERRGHPTTEKAEGEAETSPPDAPA